MIKAEGYTVWLLALIYAGIYVFIIPWVDIQGKEFEDTANYIFRIIYLKEGGTEAHLTGIRWLLDEPVWKLITITLGIVFDDYRFALYIVSFVAMVLYGSFFFRRVEFYIVMILLLNPMSVNLFIEQVRITLAFGLLLFAYDLSSKYLKALVALIAFFIHASMPIFIGVYYILHYANQKVEARKYYLITLLIALSMALFMKFGLDAILSAVGDRHAGYGDISAGSSLAYSMIWFIIAVIISIFATFEHEEERVIAGYAIVFMSFFFFGSILGVFAQRYVAVIMPIIIIAIGYLPRHFKQATYIFLFAYDLLMFKYWLELSLI
jgi:hypothetical protein